MSATLSRLSSPHAQPASDMIGLSDLLTARVKILEAEHRRERVLGVGLRLRVFGRPKSAA